MHRQVRCYLQHVLGSGYTIDMDIESILELNVLQK